MSEAERYQRVKSIFLEVCELPLPEAAAYLDRECDGDSGLRRDVESMLEQDRRGGDALDSPGLGGESSALEPGTWIGRYRIVGVLGAGGMGVVYEAEQESPRRTVALKVIRPGLASSPVLRRFEHEAQALARLQHAGIAQIYEAGRADGPRGRVAFFAMELVRGTPLLDFARERGLTMRERLELGARIADAVQHAHQRGVIHRDLKPANILVDESGQPKVLDFGISRIVDDQRAATVLTSAGQIIGTIAYMSPEQAAGDPGAIDTRSDIYSLGVVLYELLTGRLPYPVSGVMLHEALRVIGEAEPTRISSIDRRLRGDVATIITRALEKDRARRYQAGAELAEDLRRHLRDEPILARPPTAVYQLRKFARRHKAIVAGAAIASAAMVIGTAVSLRQAAVAVAARRVADEKTVAATRQAVRATIEAATVASEQGDVITARRLLGTVGEEQRAWEWRYLSAHLDSCEVLIEAEGPIGAAALSGDGEEAITVTQTGRIERWRLADGVAVASAAVDAALTGPAALSRDGSRLAGVFGEKSDRIGVWRTATGRRLAEVKSPVGAVRVLALAPDGDRVAAGGTRTFLWTLEGSSGPAGGWLHAPDLRSLTFSPDGRRVGSAYMEHILSYDAGTGWHLHVAHRVAQPPPGAVAMNDDGTQIMVAGSKRAWLYRAASGERLCEFVGHAGRVTALQVERGGSRALSAGDDGTVLVWDAATGRQLAKLTGSPGPIRYAGFGPAERAWAVSGRDLRVWDLRGRDEIDVLRGHTSFVYAVAPLDGDRRVVSGAWDGSLRVWDSLTGECAAVAGTSRGSVIAIAVLPGSAGRPGRIAAAHNDGLVSVWDADTLGHVRDVRTGTALRVAALSASADGTRLAARLEDRIIVFDTASWEPAATFELRSSSTYSAVAISPDGSLVAADGPGEEATVWDVGSERTPLRLAGHGGAVLSLAFSPDGRTLASGSADRTVRLWEADDGREVAVLAGHTDRVYGLRFSPDGARLASGSNDTTVRVWDVAAAEPVSVLRGHTDYVFSVAFTSDGSRLVSGSGDGTVRVWGVEPAHIRWRERALMGQRRAEARAIVGEQFGQVGDWNAVAQAIRDDAGLDAARREAALQVVLEQSAAIAEPGSGGSR